MFNQYDPESLITGKELEQGMTYLNSYRDWPNEICEDLAINGEMSAELIAQFAPRVLREA